MIKRYKMEARTNEPFGAGNLYWSNGVEVPVHAIPDRQGPWVNVYDLPLLVRVLLGLGWDR